MTMPLKESLNYLDIMAIIHPDQDYNNGNFAFDAKSDAFKIAMKKRGYSDEFSRLSFDLPFNNYESEALAAHFVKGIIRPGFDITTSTDDDVYDTVAKYYKSIWNLFSTFKKSKDENESVARFAFLIGHINDFLKEYIVYVYERKLEFVKSSKPLMETLSKKKSGFSPEMIKELKGFAEKKLGPMREIVRKYISDGNKHEALVAFKKKFLDEVNSSRGVISWGKYDEDSTRKTIINIEQTSEPYVRSYQKKMSWYIHLFHLIEKGGMDKKQMRAFLSQKLSDEFDNYKDLLK